MTTSTVYDTVKVQVVDGATTTTLATYSNLNKSTAYVQKTLNVLAYKGKPSPSSSSATRTRRCRRAS